MCKALSSLKTESAKNALLTILSIDSRVAEFDSVRHAAAEELATFKDATIIPDLLAASEAPHAPILSIKKTIEALGGKMTIESRVVLAEVSRMNFGERIEHSRKFRNVVDGWSASERCAYYYWIGIGVENSGPHGAALPFYAASVKANPSPDAAAWDRGFPKVTPSQKMAKELAGKYPLPDGKSPSPDKKRWWQFWKR